MGCNAEERRARNSRLRIPSRDMAFFLNERPRRYSNFYHNLLDNILVSDKLSGESYSSEYAMMRPSVITRIISVAIGAFLLWAVVLQGVKIEAQRHLELENAQEWENAYHGQVRYARYLEAENRRLTEELQALRKSGTK